MKTITRILMLCIGLLGYNAVNAQEGCTDLSACNYDELATEDDGSCDYSCLGCTDEFAENYDPEVTIDDGSCFYALCLPVALDIQENCIWDSFSGEFITRVIITPTITGVCYLEEICYQEVGGGIQGCVDLPATGQYIQSGESVVIPLLGAGVYEFTASTAQGTSDPVDVAVNCYDNQSVCGNPYAVNYDPDAEKSYELACIYDNYICDCAGTQHNIGVLLWLGDGFYEEGTGTSIWYGQPVDFSCNLWGWDCGDGGIFHDPYETCEGELPPNNGCAAPACSPLAMSFSQAECTYSDSTGYKPAFYAHFSMNGDCDIEEFTYRESSTSPWITIPVLDAGLNLTSGDSLLITDTKAEYIYQCYYSSSSGSVSPYFYFSNGTCTNENTFCDCDQNVWDSDALDLLGNGEDNVGYEGEGIGVNFNCLTWAYDCGDLGIEGDPIGVCEGILPPENGCISLIFGCSEEGACNYNESVNFDDGSCDFESCLGCTDPEACNFASTATQDDGSCDFESCLGCPDPSACNYAIGATQDDGSCDYSCLGCTDDTACNYDVDASVNDGSCDYSCLGCTDEAACNYNPDATVDDGSCSTDCLGCMDETACNYDPFALFDDGTCEFTSCLGCTDAGACNYDVTATINDGSCTYNCFGCTDEYACNYVFSATVEDGSCDYSCLGCTDEEACNYNPDASINNGSCDYSCVGCTDPEACNYNPDATVDNGTCTESCVGCNDPLACNFDPFAQLNDGSCDYVSCQGCVIPAACNYDPEALWSDDSCDFSCYGCTDPEACNYSVEYTIDNGNCDYELCAGCLDNGACNYNPQATIDAENCEYETCLGCTDVSAFNFDPTALIDDDSCIYECVSPTIDWVLSTCEGGFLYIDFNVTDLGNAGPWNMVNNISTGSMEVDEVGAYELGPFSSGDVVVCTLISQLFSSCIATSPTLSCTNSITEVNQSNFSVYPNPANEYINIEFESITSGEIALYGSNGQLVASEPLNSLNRIELNTDALAEGMYTVVLIEETGISRKTLIVTH